VFIGLRVDPVDQQASLPSGTDEAPRAAEGAGSYKREGRRFPSERAKAAQAAIQEAVAEEKKQAEKQQGKILFGIASGAAGGDILFHQVCRQLEIETRMFLALPRDQYLGKYVAPAGREWVEWFIELYRSHQREGDSDNAADPYRLARINVLADSPELPPWLQDRPHYNVGRRNHLWMLQHAVVQSFLNGDAEVTLILLWDGETRQQMGGFHTITNVAERSGIKVRRIDPDRWLRSEPSSPTLESAAPNVPPQKSG
jgi:hypothetical protein